MSACACATLPAEPPRIVITGGPGAGKTALLEVVRRMYCEHVVILPESASILFRGGFPSRPTPAAHEAAQRAIFRVQHEVERLVEEGRVAGYHGADGMRGPRLEDPLVAVRRLLRGLDAQRIRLVVAVVVAGWHWRPGRWDRAHRHPAPPPRPTPRPRTHDHR